MNLPKILVLTLACVAQSSILRRRRVILAYDMGLGKTLIALVAARAFQQSTNCAVLVLAPLSMRGAWEAEARNVGVVLQVYSWGSVPRPPAARRLPSPPPPPVQPQFRVLAFCSAHP